MAQERKRRHGLKKGPDIKVKVAMGVAACLLAAVVGAAAVGAAPRAVTVERPQEAQDDGDAPDPGPPVAEAQAGAAADQAVTITEAVMPTVHVDGAVASPGVYVVRISDARVSDAVDAAGGLADGADTSQVNLAARLEDGMKVHIPVVGEQVAAPVSATSSTATAQGGGGAPVNINSATAEQLCELPGVGEATAAAIVEDREANGPFASPEDLMRVSGIGEKKFAKLKDAVCV